MLAELREVSVRYPDGTTGLHRVSLRICPGELLLIRGVSGAGKSSLLSVLAGRLVPTSGSAVLGGHDATTLDRAGLRQWWRSTAIVSQDLRLLERRTIAENVGYAAAMAPRGLGAGATLRRLGVADLADRYPSEVSGGQRQRVALALAIVKRPALLLADEPTSNLDTDNSKVVAGLLREMAASGAAVVAASHEPGLLRGHRTVWVDRGRLFWSAPSGSE